MDTSDRHAPLYRAMMHGQALGVFTEHNLLDCAVHWWYNGDYDEYYHGYYVSKRARGA